MSLMTAADEQSGGQAGAMDSLNQFQTAYGGKLSQIGQAMHGVFGLNTELGSAVGSEGQRMLSEYKAQMLARLQQELSGANSQSSQGLATIDQLIHSLTGGQLNTNMDSVAQSFALTGANMDQSSRSFSQAEKDQIKSLSGLSSMAVSLLGDSDNQGLQDKTATQASLADARANIVAKFKELAANTTNTQIGKAMNDLAKAGNDTDIINYLIGDVKTSLAGIDADAALARDANDQKRAEFANYVTSTQAKLKQGQADILSQLANTVLAVQSELDDKTKLIGSSQAEMSQALDDVKGKVAAAQETLRQNLMLYQDKLDSIIQEIKSYMNLSADADQLAISQDIARQMGKVNATSLAIASANAAVSAKVDQQNGNRNASSKASYEIVHNVIDGAVSTGDAVADGQLAHNEALVAVAANVDASATELQDNLESSANTMEAGIVDASTVAGKAVHAAEGSQAKIADQVNIKSSDVASQSRKSFIRNVEKMGAVDDDTLRVSKQLDDLLSNTDGTIDDISGSVMSHLDLSVDTQAKLNSAEVRKVASVSDVMGAFTSVVLSFLNETGDTMETVMDQLSLVESSSKRKLKQIDVRSQDELNWVNSGLNKSSDNFAQISGQERTAQEGLTQGVLASEGKIAQSQTDKTSELNDINEAIGALRQEVIKGQANHLAKVRAWINSRNPSVAQGLLDSPSSSFIESKSRDAVIHDIQSKISLVNADIAKLRGAQV